VFRSKKTGLSCKCPAHADGDAVKSLFPPFFSFVLLANDVGMLKHHNRVEAASCRADVGEHQRQAMTGGRRNLGFA
jgi:hypothetical protein